MFEPLIDAKRVGTLSKKQRNMINEGVSQVNREDEAIKTCLKAAEGRVDGLLEKIVCLLPCPMDLPQVGRYGYGSNEGAVSHRGKYDTS